MTATSTFTQLLSSDQEVGEEGKLYLMLHCRHQNDSCVKTGGGESHFNFSLVVKDKVTRQRPQTSAFEEKGEPKRNRIEVPLFTSLTPYRLAEPTFTMFELSVRVIYVRISISLVM